MEDVIMPKVVIHNGTLYNHSAFAIDDDLLRRYLPEDDKRVFIAKDSPLTAETAREIINHDSIKGLLYRAKAYIYTVDEAKAMLYFMGNDDIDNRKYQKMIIADYCNAILVADRKRKDEKSREKGEKFDKKSVKGQKIQTMHP